MFTGIIESVGHIAAFDGRKLIVSTIGDSDDSWILGESVAIDGCCLTLISSFDGLQFEVSEETVSRTSFKSLKLDDAVNVERAMKADGRFGGHIVQGHVDAVGQLVSVTQTEASHIMRFKVGEEFDGYLVDKGSIAINGISLTVVSPEKGEFDTWIIPHTWNHTSLHRLQPGDPVNIEFDVLAKYVARMLTLRSDL